MESRRDDDDVRRSLVDPGHGMDDAIGIGGGEELEEVAGLPGQGLDPGGCACGALNGGDVEEGRSSACGIGLYRSVMSEERHE